VDTDKILERILKIENPILTPSGRLDIPPRVPRCTKGCRGCFNYFLSKISPYTFSLNIVCYNTSEYIATGKWWHLAKPIDELQEDEYLELLELILRYYE